MTVKSPFYNKPSTSTSVDSCHKCPFISPLATQDIPPVPSTDPQIQQDQLLSGFDQRLFETSNQDNTDVNNLEPCNSSVATMDIGTTLMTSCSNCGTTTTPLWRRSPQGQTICNACGLYLKARNTTRPPGLKRHSNTNFTQRPLAPAPIVMTAPIFKATHPIPIAPHYRPLDDSNSISDCDKDESSSSSSSPPPPPSSSSDADGVTRTMICFNCNTFTTPLWRRDKNGETICNACGLYYKLHSVHRPITMKRSIIKRRKRVTTTGTTIEISTTLGTKRKCDQDDIIRLPVFASKSPPIRNVAEPMEPGAFQRNNYRYLPSPPLHPLADLLNPINDQRLPPISLPSPPMVSDDSPTSLDTTAFDKISTLFNTTAQHGMLEAHRHELQRKVSNLTCMLTRTTAMLENIDQVIAVAGDHHRKNLME